MNARLLESLLSETFKYTKGLAKFGAVLGGVSGAGLGGLAGGPAGALVGGAVGATRGAVNWATNGLPIDGVRAILRHRKAQAAAVRRAKAVKIGAATLGAAGLGAAGVHYMRRKQSGKKRR